MDVDDAGPVNGTLAFEPKPILALDDSVVNRIAAGEVRALSRRVARRRELAPSLGSRPPQSEQPRLTGPLPSLLGLLGEHRSSSARPTRSRS